MDFLPQNGTALLPTVVKSITRLNSKSLSVYIDRFAPELVLRYSMNNLKQDGTRLNIPLFLADWTELLKVAADE